jgi:GT2 family glycosyltransferase
MKNPKVSILIVNFNGGKVFEECIKSLQKINYKNYEVIVVDNGSDVKPILPKTYKLILNKENSGFVGGNNIGFKYVTGKYVLFLNNDTKVSPDLLKITIAKMESDSNIGVLQPKIYLMDKPGYLDNAGSFFTNIGFLDHWGFNKKDSPEFDKEREIFSAKGACMIARKDLIDKIGLFDEEYFAYFEESDFCWRVWLASYKIIFYPKTYIYHKVGFTTKRGNVNRLNYLYYRNRIDSLIKNLEFKNLIWIVPLHVFLSFGIAILFLMRGSFKNFKLILLAIIWNGKNFFRIWKKRQAVQSLRKVSDADIFRRVGTSVNFLKHYGDFKRVEKDLS